MKIPYRSILERCYTIFFCFYSFVNIVKKKRTADIWEPKDAPTEVYSTILAPWDLHKKDEDLKTIY